ALLVTKDSRLVPLLTASLIDAPPSHQVVVMRVLGARAATESLPAIGSLLSSNHPEVRSTAFMVLQCIVTPADLSLLLSLLPDAREHTPQVQSAIMAAINRSNDRASDIHTLI